MKRLRLDRCAGQLLARPRTCSSPATGSLRYARSSQHLVQSIRSNSTAVAFTEPLEAEQSPKTQTPWDPRALPSPSPERSLRSAKLAALHARLSLSPRIPLQTLARTLIDASADENPQFNNTNLAFVGQTIMNYHVAEWIMCRYPRLPMTIVWEAMKGYAGNKTLFQVAKSWGVESAAAPGGEVDPGLLQFDHSDPSKGVALLGFGYTRVEVARLPKCNWRRGVANRVVFDDDFGNEVKPTADGGLKTGEREISDEDPAYMRYGNEDTRNVAEKAHALFVRAVVGAVYAHCGRDTAKAFIKAHILSRTLDLARVFRFNNPTVELATLCARENFEAPVARLLSETGRLSRTPVFVVGIYSGKDKLGEAAGPSLDAARWKAAMNALKSWYLYSPGDNIRVPSDVLENNAKPWTPAYIDMGEIISR
jgi:dsRNA-specific ribonuclease